MKVKGGWMDGWMEDFWFLLKKKKKKRKKKDGPYKHGVGGVRKLDTTSWQKLLELYNDRKKQNLY